MIILPLFTHAQKSEESSRFQFGISFSPDLQYRWLRVKEETGYTSQIVEIRNEMEQPKFGITTGLNVKYVFNNRWSLQSGIIYSNNGYKTKKTEAIWPEPDPSLATHIRSKYDIHYVNVPFIVNYAIGKGKMKLLINSGLVLNTFIQENFKGWLYYSDDTKETFTSKTNSGYRRFMFSGLIGAGVQYEPNKKSEFRIMPTFRCGLPSISKNTPISGNLWSLGIDFSCFFKL